MLKTCMVMKYPELCFCAPYAFTRFFIKRLRNSYKKARHIKIEKKNKTLSQTCSKSHLSRLFFLNSAKVKS